MGNVETIRTSSSRRDLGSENRPNTIGCMSGVFHILSRHHNRSRKRLTSAKRKEKPDVSPSSRPAPPPPRLVDEDGRKKTEPRRSSCETPRSPTIPQEIRRQGAVAAASPANPRRPPALMARLMGLEDAPAPPAADKRRELLRALEKCNEDLQALRRIIEAVRLAEVKAKAVSSATGDWKMDCNGEQPSPVSILDSISSPRYRSKRFRNEKQETPAVGSRIVRPSRSRTGVLFVGEKYNEKACNATEFCSFYPVEAMARGLELKGGAMVGDLGPARRAEEAARRGRQRRSVSRAMEESVEEVWEDGAWEERWREVARVGAAVEADILWDLVEELAVDLLGWRCRLSPPLPPLKKTCRKRLRF